MNKRGVKNLSINKRTVIYGLMVAVFILGAVFMAGYAAGMSARSSRPVSETPTETMNADVTPVSEPDTNDGEHYTDDGLLRLNYATAEELTELPGIGESTAAKIIEYRESKREAGGFTAVAELMLISGIGETKFEQIRPYVTVD